MLKNPVLFEKITAVVVQIEDKPLPLVDRIQIIAKTEQTSGKMQKSELKQEKLSWKIYSAKSLR